MQLLTRPVSLGIDETDCTKGTLEVYKLYFEQPYIGDTKNYYQKESRQFLADNSVVEYMKKAEVRLEEEKQHVTLYLHNEIMSPLIKQCCTTLIADHAPILRDEFQQLLNYDRLEDLGRMYKLLQRVTDGLDPLRARFEKHVVAAGKAAVAKVVSEAEGEVEPKSYVLALLSIHTQYAGLVHKAFDGEAEFVRSLDSACREFVNHNQVCDKSTNRSPEMLAKYTDGLLKKTAQTVEDNEMEALLTQVVCFQAHKLRRNFANH